VSNIGLNMKTCLMVVMYVECGSSDMYLLGEAMKRIEDVA
jgi:hypothetical protein